MPEPADHQQATPDRRLEPAPGPAVPATAPSSHPVVDAHPRLGNQTMQRLHRDRAMPAGQFLTQRSLVGNRTLQRLLRPPLADGPLAARSIQRQPAGEATSSWAAKRRQIQSARKNNDDAGADRLTREAIATAAAGAIFPPGIAKVQPAPGDILLDPKIAADAHAQTRPKDIPANPANYWRWLFFTPNLIDGSEVQVRSIITHELVHVAQFTRIWTQYQADTSPNKSTWDDYLKPYQERKRVEGPEELQAHLTSLEFLKRLAPGEQITALRGLFSSYISTAAYVPPAGEAVAITTADVGPRILSCFANAAADLQERMGAQLWWSLMDVAPAKPTWIAVLKDLRPVAVKGYADPSLRPIYDNLLRDEGIKSRDWR